MKWTPLLGCTLLAVTLWGVGCATYVNIPPQAGDVASQSPNDGTVLEAEAAATRAAIERLSLAEPFTLIALPDTAPSAYFDLLRRVSELATADDIEGGTSLEVRQMLIRGWKGKVDLVYRPGGGGGQPRLVTVDLEWQPFGGWHSTYVRVWNPGVERTLRTAGPPADVQSVP